MTRILEKDHVISMVKALRNANFKTLDVERTRNSINASIVKKDKRRVNIFSALRNSNSGLWVVRHDDKLFKRSE